MGATYSMVVGLVAITQRQKTPEEIIDQGGPQGLKTS
jgi:hypothetical protein